jgi:hypothetical protein
MRKIASVAMILSLMVVSFGCTEYHQQGAESGAVIGGTSGAILDHRNPWRGGIIGMDIGAIAGATLADISYRASSEAAMHNRAVEYRTEDGRGVYRADPVGYNERTRCKDIHERVWEDDRLVRDVVRELCEERYIRHD